jgi:hypothetical protein
MSGEHQTWSVDSTAYLRNLDREDLRAECIAVHYQSAPTKTERGTSIGLRFPTLIVAGYVEKPREVADKIAAILNAHWIEDDATTPPARSYADEDVARIIDWSAWSWHDRWLKEAETEKMAGRAASLRKDAKAHVAASLAKAAAIRLLSQGGKA